MSVLQRSGPSIFNGRHVYDAVRIEHFPPKAWRGLDPGWAPARAVGGLSTATRGSRRLFRLKSHTGANKYVHSAAFGRGPRPALLSAVAVLWEVGESRAVWP